ncbi:MAG: hypothetical protein ACXVB4_09195 [Pseudobdellovibrionaceae bacterium]
MKIKASSIRSVLFISEWFKVQEVDTARFVFFLEILRTDLDLHIVSEASLEGL